MLFVQKSGSSKNFFCENPKILSDMSIVAVRVDSLLSWNSDLSCGFIA